LTLPVGTAILVIAVRHRRHADPDPHLESTGKFSLNWSYLNAIANGVSAIDLGALALRNLHDARQFVREYGFDLDQPAAPGSSCRPTKQWNSSASTFLTPQQAR
jgi:hypothetical protein